MISKVLDIQYSRVDRLEASFAKGGIVCYHGRLDCDLKSYGTLIRHLCKMGVWPRKVPEQVHCTADALIKALKYDPSVKHINCEIYKFEGKSKKCSLVFQVQSSTLIANTSKPRNRRYLPESKQDIVVPGESQH
jgi:hypothetical protein